MTTKLLKENERNGTEERASSAPFKISTTRAPSSTQRKSRDTGNCRGLSLANNDGEEASTND